jgi:hypothetical protein
MKKSLLFLFQFLVLLLFVLAKSALGQITVASWSFDDLGSTISKNII